MSLTAAIRFILRWLSRIFLGKRPASHVCQPVSMPSIGPTGASARPAAHTRPGPRVANTAATPSRPTALNVHQPSPSASPPARRTAPAQATLHHRIRLPRRHADVQPQTRPKITPPHLKSFLEKTLTRANLAAQTLLALLLLTAYHPAPTHDLHVFAAASLREALTETADAFQRATPNVRVVPNVAGSQVLRLQIESGARADLVISANPNHLEALQHAGLLLAPPTVVATNALVLAVPAGNPAGVSGIAALTQPGRRLVMATESVPAGAYARQMLALHASQTGQPGFVDAVLQRVISFETNVRQVAAKLELGEADAGFVYRTDVLASNGRLQVIQTPPHVQVTAHYPAATLRDAPNPELAQRFLTFLHSPEAQAILTRHGFAPAAADSVR